MDQKLVDQKDLDHQVLEDYLLTSMLVEVLEVLTDLAVQEDSDQMVQADEEASDQMVQADQEDMGQDPADQADSDLPGHQVPGEYLLILILAEVLTGQDDPVQAEQEGSDQMVQVDQEDMDQVVYQVPGDYPSILILAEVHTGQEVLEDTVLTVKVDTVQHHLLFQSPAVKVLATMRTALRNFPTLHTLHNPSQAPLPTSHYLVVYVTSLSLSCSSLMAL